MKPGTWDRLEAVFFQAIELPEGDREAFVAEACAGDQDLRREVEAVLAAHLSTGTPTNVADEDPAGWIGRRVGAYLLEERVGQGGMGDVYRARRADDAYQQEVAVKLVRSGLRPVEMARRFRLERQILARLEHPDIATLLDGGITSTGQPYLVMQHVVGRPITDWVDGRGLGVRERLALFVRVCRAVQFAHANLVVHRDLKPSNILVTEEGDVRLLDFGIAKLLDPEAGDELPTESLLLLTPEHAAPEQFLGLPVTTATDVYQLGVLLYELLTGTRPFTGGGSLEIHRAICEEEPTRPSAAWGAGASPARDADGPHRSPSDTVSLADAARVRTTTPDALRRTLRGDLDRIVLMALRKEPERRYATVADLADDVERYLGGYPVLARPHGLGYVVGRFVRRHRFGVAASAALVAALAVIVVGSLRFAATTSQQAVALAEERDVAVEVSDFLASLFESADPFETGPERRDTLRIRDLLDEGAERVRRDLAGQPVLQARLLSTLGSTNRNLGRLDASRPLLEEASRVLEEELGPRAVQLAALRVDLAELLRTMGEHEAAAAVLDASLDVLADDSVVNARRMAAALSGRGSVHQDRGRFEEAERDYRRALRLAQTDPELDDGRRAEHLSNLATALTRQAKWTEAEALLRQAAEMARGHHGSDHPTTASMLNNLGYVLREQERFDDAEGAFKEALAIRRALFEAPHPDLAVSVNNLAELTLARGDPEGAEPLFLESLELRRAIYGDEQPAVGLGMLNLAAVRQRLEGGTEDALRLYAEAKGILETSLAPDHPLVGAVEGNLGRLHHDAGDHATALGHYQTALEIRRATYEESHPLILGNRSDVGGCLADLGRYDEGEEVLLRVFDDLQPRQEELSRVWDSLLVRLTRLYRGMGREDEADRYEAMRTPDAP